MERYIFEERLKNFSSLIGWDVEKLREMWNSLSELSPHERAALNPIDLAPRFGLSLDDTITFFLYGTAAEIFQARWNVFSPGSGWILATYPHLREISRQRFFDPFIEHEVEVDLETTVAVTFGIKPQFFDDHVSPFEGSFESYFGGFFAPHMVPKPEFVEFDKNRRLSFHVFATHEFGKIPLTPKAGEVYRIVNRETGSYFTINVRGKELRPGATFYEKMVFFKETQAAAAAVQSIDLEVTDNGYSLRTGELQPGRAVIWVQNLLATKAGFHVHLVDSFALSKMRRLHPHDIRPHLTGKMLLNNALYRELFLQEPLPDGYRVKITGLTMVQTNFTNATTLLDKLGDRDAHDFLTKKVANLQDRIQERGGFLVKTISDEVMAAFPNPLDAVQASWEMMLDLWEVPYGEDRSELKIGIHTGPALVVKSNGALDFFGRTVNVATKLQDLASAKEIWVSMAVYSYPGVADFLQNLGSEVVQHIITLKGDDQKSIAYQCPLPLKEPPRLEEEILTMDLESDEEALEEA